MSKLLTDNYITYFIAVITLIIVCESFRNPEQTILLLLKDIVNLLVVKLLIIGLSLYVGYYNQVLHVLILIISCSKTERENRIFC